MPITLYCSQCGYNLTGVCSAEQPAGACPECGAGFDYQYLVKEGGMVFPPIRGPLLWLLAPPFMAVGVCLSGFMLLAAANSSESLEVIVWGSLVLAGLILLLGFGLCVFTGRRLARRVAARPPGSGPNLGSTTLTILFATVFATAQVTLACSLFFFGCIGMIMVMEGT